MPNSGHSVTRAERSRSHWSCRGQQYGSSGQRSRISVVLVARSHHSSSSLRSGSPCSTQQNREMWCPRHRTTGREPVAVHPVVMARLHRHGDWWVTGWPSGAERRGPLTQPTASRPISGPIQHGNAQLDSTALTRPSPRRARPLVKGTGSSGLDRQHPPGAEIELSPGPQDVDTSAVGRFYDVVDVPDPSHSAGAVGA
jgi:hypothetical protein